MTRRRYPSDTTDAEWALIKPLLPVPACRTARGGRPEKHPRREIVDAIRYIVDNGCKWRAMPHDLPPWRTVYGFFRRWANSGVIGRIRDQLREQIRIRMGRCPNPVTAVIDSQSVKAAETAAKDTRGWDNAKKVNGRKRHLVVDTKGLPIIVLVTGADVQDRDAAKEVLVRLKLMHPELVQVWADGAYAGELVAWANSALGIALRISKRPKNAQGFVPLKKRWVVERSLSWIMRARRNTRDVERLIQHSEAHITWALIRVMAKRLAEQRVQPEIYPSALSLAA
jgi:transposase